MAEHIDDDEQVEALKRWWAENGRSTLIAVVLAVGGTLGWQQYQGWSEQQRELASDAWSSALVKLDSADSAQQDEGLAGAARVIEDYPGTTYARFAALKLAAIAVQNENLTDAEKWLRQALASGAQADELGQLIQLRLARVLVASGDESAALKILSQQSQAYGVSYATARGDLHLAAGRPKDALAAYREARAASLAEGNPPGILDIKITSLESRLAEGSTS